MHVSLHTARAAHPPPAVFLDRDGTINVEKNYLYRIEDWEWIPNADQAIRQLKTAGFLVVVISNQAGIARGLYTAEDVMALHHHVSTDLHSAGGTIDAYYFCPHHPEHGEQRCCECRKPKPEMLLAAAMALNIDLKKSWMVGDKGIDLLAAKAAGTQGILVQTGHGATEQTKLLPGTIVAADLPAAVSIILQHHGANSEMTP
jgi:D-glycero-D-manno-heptose 1,7-bisphosphate phosphatase